MHRRSRIRMVFTIAALLILCGFVTWVSRGVDPGRVVATPSAAEEIPAAPAPARETLSREPGTASFSLADARAPDPLPVANRPAVKIQPSTREQAANGRSIAEILAGADMTDPATRARVVAEIEQLEHRQTQAVLAKARLLGIPARIEGPGRKLSILYDFRGDEPLYRNTLNKNAAISTAANLVAPAPYSLDGDGIKVGVWDGGLVRSTHVELTGRVTRKNSSSISDDHGTHVAGTIAATGILANAKGMAPKSTIDSYDWNNDYSEMTAAGAASASDTARISLSNHSYGYGAFTSDMGRYDIEARNTDAITASLPFYLIFWASGNEQDDLTAKGGYQSITFNGLAKNIVTVGAVNDAVSGGVRSTAAATIASFSSLGPCDDGRIKPDLVANGVSVYSTIATSNSAYDGTYSGTSMATPSAVGSAALLAQLYAREFSGQRLRASTLKALLIHTADDLGPAGPDYKYGWGLINTRAAADLILAHENSLATPKIIDGQITNSRKTQTHTFTWDGVSPIRATLCWTDPAGNVETAADSRNRNLKHNLDAKITAPDGTTVYQPFVMPFVGSWTTASMALAATRAKNNVDNVEQVFLSAPTQPGTYTVTVSLDGTLNPDNQAYSLILTGGASIESNPSPVLISQIYGGGGSTGAVFKQDYVELHNRSAAAVSLAGWSVQYAAATGTTWQVAALGGTIAPGGYWLLGLSGGSSGAALPAVNASASISMSATAGKLVLMNSTSALSGSSPLGSPGLQDFVGFGSANAYEAAPAPAPSATTAIFRAGSGSMDTGNNAMDFTAAAPGPRNSASAAATSFDDWIAVYQVDGLTGFAADPDRDGIPNAVENFLGTAPDSTSPGLTQIAATATALTFQHTRSNTPAAGLVSSYEWSTDLQTWHPSAASVGGRTVVIADSILADHAAPLNDLIQVTATVTQGAAPQLHVRLKVSLP